MAESWIPPEIRLMWYRIVDAFWDSTMPRQLKSVPDNPRGTPEYARQVKFLEENRIDKPYDCFQCQRFSSDADHCYTKFKELFCGDIRRDRMCPGFDPPEDGVFELSVRTVYK